MARPPIPPPPAKRRIDDPLPFEGIPLKVTPKSGAPRAPKAPTPRAPQDPAPRAPKPRQAVPHKLDIPLNGSGPPLFIKIDKYRDVVDSLHKLKAHAVSLRDALDALGDIEKELSQGLSLTNQALDRFSTIITSIDSKITRIPPSEVDRVDTDEMDDFVAGLHDQMGRIRKDLEDIRA